MSPRDSATGEELLCQPIIFWKSKITGFEGHGERLEISYEDGVRFAKESDERWPDIEHHALPLYSSAADRARWARVKAERQREKDNG